MRLRLYVTIVAIVFGFQNGIAGDSFPTTAAPLFDATDAGISRRVMLSVANPSETIASQLQIGVPGVAVPGAGAAGAVAGVVGHLIGTLIIKAINENDVRNAQIFSEQVARALAKIDVRGEFTDQLKGKLEETGYLPGIIIEKVEDPSDLEQPGLLIRIEENDIFTLESVCSFDAHFTSVHVVSTIRLWRKGQFKPVYSTRLHYMYHDFANDSKDRSRWVAHDGELLLRSLREGIYETARLVMADISIRTSRSTLNPRELKASWITADTGKKVTSAVYLVADGENRILVAAKSHPSKELLSIPRERLELQPAP